jgi:hypothetical protein
MDIPNLNKKHKINWGSPSIDYQKIELTSEQIDQLLKILTPFALPNQTLSTRDQVGVYDDSNAFFRFLTPAEFKYCKENVEGDNCFMFKIHDTYDEKAADEAEYGGGFYKSGYYGVVFAIDEITARNFYKRVCNYRAPN